MRYQRTSIFPSLMAGSALAPMMANNSAGTNGPAGQTATTTPMMGVNPQNGMPMLVNAGSMPAPANCVSVCPPSAAMWNNPGMWSVNQMPTMECITWPLYSYQSYPAAGGTSFTFFQTQVGPNATIEDTNMQAAGALPSPQKFLVYGIGVNLLSGLAPTQGPRADASTGALNDFYAVMRRGALTFTIGEKPYLRYGPLMNLPVRAHLSGLTSIDSQTTPASALQVLTQFGYSEGDVFRPIPLLLEANQNFVVNIGFPGGAIALPSSDSACRIGVELYGVLYRASQ